MEKASIAASECFIQLNGTQELGYICVYVVKNDECSDTGKSVVQKVCG